MILCSVAGRRADGPPWLKVGSHFASSPKYPHLKNSPFRQSERAQWTPEGSDWAERRGRFLFQYAVPIEFRSIKVLHTSPDQQGGSQGDRSGQPRFLEICNPFLHPTATAESNRMIRIRYVIILPRVAGRASEASCIRAESQLRQSSLLAPVARQAAQSFRSRRLLSLPGRIAHDPDQGCAAICMRGSHPRQHRSGVGGRPRRLDRRVFGIFVLYLKRLCVCCRCSQTTKASARCVVVVVWMAVELLQTTTSKRPRTR